MVPVEAKMHTKIQHPRLSSVHAFGRPGRTPSEQAHTRSTHTEPRASRCIHRSLWTDHLCFVVFVSQKAALRCFSHDVQPRLRAGLVVHS